LAPRLAEISFAAIFCIYMPNKQSFKKTLLSKLMIKLKRFFLLAAALLFIVISSDVYAEPISVIANSSVTFEQLKLKDLRSIYTMKKRLWAEGEPVSVFVYSGDNSIHKAFCRELLKVFPRQLESVWYRLVYSGTGASPIRVNSEAEMLERVANTPGAIGYLQSESLNEKTKIITIK